MLPNFTQDAGQELWTVFCGCTSGQRVRGCGADAGAGTILVIKVKQPMYSCVH